MDYKLITAALLASAMLMGCNDSSSTKKGDISFESHLPEGGSDGSKSEEGAKEDESEEGKGEEDGGNQEANEGVGSDNSNPGSSGDTGVEDSDTGGEDNKDTDDNELSNSGRDENTKENESGKGNDAEGNGNQETNEDSDSNQSDNDGSHEDGNDDTEESDNDEGAGEETGEKENDLEDEPEESKDEEDGDNQEANEGSDGNQSENGSSETEIKGPEVGDKDANEPEEDGVVEEVSAKSFIFAEPVSGQLERKLWYSNGTAENTVMLGEYLGIASDIALSSKAARLSDSQWVFTSGLGLTTQTYVTDGTEEGTKVLSEDITHADDFVRAGDTVFFKAGIEGKGTELAWVKESEAGDLQFDYVDIREGSFDSQPTHITAFNDKVYFRAVDDEHGMEIFVSNGTKEGTQILHETSPNCTASGSPFNSQINGIRTAGEKLYFTASHRTCDSSESVLETLWVYDGEDVPVVINAVSDAISDDDHIWPRNFMSFDGKLFFTIGRDLWVSDGTEAGTTTVGSVCDSECDNSFGINSASDEHALFFMQDGKYWLVKKDPGDEDAYGIGEISQPQAAAFPINVNGTIYARTATTVWVDTQNGLIIPIDYGKDDFGLDINVSSVAEDGVASYGIGVHLNDAFVQTKVLHKAQVDKDGNVSVSVVKELD